MTFIERLWLEYPIPKELSVWGGDGVMTVPIESLDSLVETCTTELASDLLVIENTQANGMTTILPESTISVMSAMLSDSFPFQGNRLVKCTYDSASHKAFLRYFPATITYQRRLVRSDLETLEGDRLVFAKSFVLWKMATRELVTLKTVALHADNGQIDLADLKEFRDENKTRYMDLKEIILLYNTVN